MTDLQEDGLMNDYIPETVKLANGGVKWQRITGLNGSHGP